MVETTGRKCDVENQTQTHTQTFNGFSGRQWWSTGAACGGTVVGSSDSSSRNGDGECTVHLA
jgi:hypothetical protein